MKNKPSKKVTTKNKPRILINMEGGIIQNIDYTSGDFELTVIDQDVEDGDIEEDGSSKLVYYRCKGDNKVTVSEYNESIKEIEDYEADLINNKDEDDE